MSRNACCVLRPPLKPYWELVKILFSEIYLTSLSYIILSKHLLKMDSKEIGLQLLTQVSSYSLNIGIILVSLRLVGYLPFVTDRLKILARGTLIAYLQHFRILAGNE